MSAPLSALDRRILEALTRAAEQAAPCPTNAELSKLIGKKSETSAIEAIQRLEARMLIRVTRYGRARVVEILTRHPGSPSALVTVAATQAPPPSGRSPHYQYRSRPAPYGANPDPVSRETGSPAEPPGPLFTPKTA